MRNFGNIKRIVVKIGTSTLTSFNGTLNENIIQSLTDTLATLHKAGKQIAIVTCGAIGAGVTRLKLPYYPIEMQEKQAAASVGQVGLMNAYIRNFDRYNITIAQLLLTKYTVQRDDTLANATNTLNTLFQLGVIPIINENDAIITDEIKSGDNDSLAAGVANIIKADLLILLTDVDGVYDRDPRLTGANIIPEITRITDEIKSAASNTSSNPRSTGGMMTKLAAAVTASKTGTKTIIMNGNNPSNILATLNGTRLGTFIDLR